MKTTGLSFALLVLLAASALAQVPRTINYQGRARANGQPVTGVHNMTLALYDSQTSGNLVFSETHFGVQFTNDGIFTVAIGDATPGGLPEDLLFDQPYWLGVTISGVNGDQELVPRLTLRSTPYSMRAEVADSAGAIPSQIVTQNHDGAGFSVDNSSGSVGIEASGTDFGIISHGPMKSTGHVTSEYSAGDNDGPNPGSLYYDNAPIAWAQIDGRGNIIADFGIAGVTTPTSTSGVYHITLDNSVIIQSSSKAPAIAPVITPFNTNSDQPIIVPMWTYDNDGTGISDNSFYVYMRNLNGQTVNFPFTIVVFGRPE